MSLWKISLALLFALNAAAEPVVDFDFNRVTDCKGEFGYEQAFLFAGRPANTPLVRDSAATSLLQTGSAFFNPLPAVSHVYSIELFPGYPDFVEGRRIRYGIALVEQSQPKGDSSLQYRLILMVTSGSLRGHVQSIHSATVDERRKQFISDRFTCRLRPVRAP